jgi:ABC-type transport system involved in multi-copper enzyme maturation permease subunit
MMRSQLSTLSKFKAKLAGWRSWELNPVVIKELRQAVRNWSVTGMLLLFLTVLYCTALTFLISHSFDTGGVQSLGAQIFQVFTAILTGASLLFIPLYVGVRLAAERQDSNLDLLYITTLSPGQIIRGKFLAAFT